MPTQPQAETTIPVRGVTCPVCGLVLVGRRMLDFHMERTHPDYHMDEGPPLLPEQIGIEKILLERNESVRVS
jgi:hypothetical protein